MFQSTPSRGGRQKTSHEVGNNRGFNPRPHAEGDVIKITLIFPVVWFQSTPSRGGRRVKALVKVTSPVSIHALTRRAT